MEIKGIGRVISSYKTHKVDTPKKTGASASVKKTDRVEFGFETALSAAKSGIVADIKADAAPEELADARQTAEAGVSAKELISRMLMG